MRCSSETLLAALSGILFVVLTPAALTGQASVRVTAQTALAVSAIQTQSVPAGTNITSGLSLSEGGVIPSPFGTCIHSADLDVIVTQSPTAPSVDYNTSAFPPGLGCGFGLASAGGDILAEFQAAQPTAGRIVVSFNVSFFAHGSVLVDVGNDGIAEHSQLGTLFAPAQLTSFTVDAPAVIGPTPVPVLVRNSSANGAVPISIDFIPGSSGLSSYGNACGPSFSAYFATELAASGNRTLGLETAGSPPGSVGFFVIGATQLQIPIPPTGCELLTDILAAVPAPVSAQGAASRTIPVPASIRGSVLMQFLAGSSTPQGILWNMSNGMAIQIP